MPSAALLVKCVTLWGCLNDEMRWCLQQYLSAWPRVRIQVDGEKVETVTDFILLGFRVTEDSNCSQEIKRCLVLRGKAMINLFKKQTSLHWQRSIYSKLWFFQYSCNGFESWTIKKAEHWRIDASELWCWRRLLRVPWTAKRSNQSILKEISPEYSLEGLMLKLRLQYFGLIIRRTDSLEKTLMLKRQKAGREEGDRMRWSVGITDSVGMSLSKLWEIVQG